MVYHYEPSRDLSVDMGNAENSETATGKYAYIPRNGRRRRYTCMEKYIDSAPLNKLWYVLKSKVIPSVYVKTVKELYENITKA